MPQPKPLPPVELLREYFDYDPDSGVVRYKKPRKRIRVGEPAGNCRPDGYLKISIDRKNYMLHRVIWKMMTGEEPPVQIDHKDRCRSNNTWSNLRAADPAKNNQNKRKVGKFLPGVSQSKRCKNFYARIVVNGKFVYLGMFGTELEAHAAYKAASVSYFGEFSSYADEISSSPCPVPR
jgi:hypothetical protein